MPWRLPGAGVSLRGRSLLGGSLSCRLRMLPLLWSRPPAGKARRYQDCSEQRDKTLFRATLAPLDELVAGVGCQLRAVSGPDRLRGGVKREVDPGNPGTPHGASAPQIACAARRACASRRIRTPHGRQPVRRLLRTPRPGPGAAPCWCPRPAPRMSLHVTSHADSCLSQYPAPGPSPHSAPCPSQQLKLCLGPGAALCLCSHPASRPGLQPASRPGLHSAPWLCLRAAPGVTRCPLAPRAAARRVPCAAQPGLHAYLGVRWI